MEVMTDSFRNLFNSERLVYTALEETDQCKDLWWKCRSSNLVNRSLIDAGQPGPPSRASSDKELESSLNARKPYLAVTICLPAATAEDAVAADKEPTPIGYLILNKSFPGTATYHLALLDEYQNKGYGREAINWAADYAFKWCNMHRLSIGCLAYNERACHLYGSMGFVQEARMRSCFYLNGTWHDLIEFSMLKEEWEKLRGISA